MLRADAEPPKVRKSYLLAGPARVFDGIAGQAERGLGRARVTGETIADVGPAAQVHAAGRRRAVDRPGPRCCRGSSRGTRTCCSTRTTRPRGTIRCCEPLALRVARATNHARATLLGGFTTTRDLGTEGAAEADVGISRRSIRESSRGRGCWRPRGRSSPPRTYAPRGFAPEWHVPQGAEEADFDSLIRVVRGQIGRRGRLDQGLRRLPLGPEGRGAADVLARGDAADSSRLRATASARWSSSKREQGPEGMRRGPCSPAPRRSSTQPLGGDWIDAAQHRDAAEGLFGAGNIEK